jgi:anti-sigma B factor antagonist
MNDQLVSLRTERSNGSLLVRVQGEIDLSNSEQVHQQLQRVIEGSPRVLIDLSEIEYLDSQGLRLIKQIGTKAEQDGANIQLIAPPRSFARQALELARLSEYIEIRDTPEL